MKKWLKIILILLLVIAVLGFLAYQFLMPDYINRDYISEFKKLQKDESQVRKNPNNDLYWGDTHLHTNNSPDAFANGVRISPDAAYRFAKGQSIQATSGITAKLNRPLDFLVVSDHAEGFGLAQAILDGNEVLMKDKMMRRWKRLFELGIDSSMVAGAEMPVSMAKGTIDRDLINRKTTMPIYYKTWIENIHHAERHYEPGKFTSLLGYEWSSMPDGNNLHRVVIYRDGGDKASQMLPLPATVSNDPETLWKYMGLYEKVSGGKVLAIPHNGNLSNGRMFSLSDLNENPMTRKYAQTRAKYEPVVETTQYKGDGETHPIISPNDEFASYGINGWDYGNMTLMETKTDDMLEFEYSRGALKNGMLLEEKLGVNPYKFGMIGSTDSHTGMSAADENEWFGKFTHQENNPNRMFRIGRIFSSGKLIRTDWQYLSSGYAGVWAESNTRKDIWDAFYRKEVYGTTGSRMKLRFFGGWDFKDSDIENADYVTAAYKNGVPMGGDLTAAEDGQSPTFIIAATKDPIGANLDRVQVIKGWIKDGETHEEVYDVAWSGDRVQDATGKLPAVGNTVDVETASWTNDIGSEELITVWTDPEFDPDLRAFYYVRLLEIPTPRWTTYDKVKHGLNLPADIPLSVQERAYSSPIWYTPQ